jgi:hypothetical protein
MSGRLIMSGQEFKENGAAGTGQAGDINRPVDGQVFDLVPGQFRFQVAKEPAQARAPGKKTAQPVFKGADGKGFPCGHVFSSSWGQRRDRAG